MFVKFLNLQYYDLWLEFMNFLVEEKKSKTFILMGWIIVPLNILLLKFYIMMFWCLQPAHGSGGYNMPEFKACSKNK